VTRPAKKKKGGGGLNAYWSFKGVDPRFRWQL
jgi:hypothetical protein